MDLTIQEKTELFARENNGEILDPIHGDFGAISYRVKVNNHIFHIYYNREWYRKYNGVTLGITGLRLALDENAMLVFFMNKEQYWIHSLDFNKYKFSVRNSTTTEPQILVQKKYLHDAGIDFPRGIDSW